MNHIVIIHAGAIGDLVQTFPTLRAIRAKWPAARLTLIGRAARTVLARMAGLCDRCIDLEHSGLWLGMGDGAARPVPACLGEADLVVDFLTRRVGAPAGAECLHVEGLPPAAWTESAAAWVLGEVSRRIELPPVPPVPEIPIPAEALASARRVLAEKRCPEPLLVIHPGSGSLKKNWPLARFAELAGRLRCETGRPILWLTGPAEVDRGIVPPAEPRDTVLAEIPLDQVAGLLALAALYVGNDSGITQVAAAVRRSDGGATPTVALFGPTDRRVWAPRGRHVRVVGSAGGSLADLSVDEVWAAAAAALA